MSTGDVQTIRQDPNQYVRPSSIGLSPDGLILELAALSTMESYLSGYLIEITIEITGPHSAILRDNGRPAHA